MNKKVKVEYVLIGQSLTFEIEYRPDFLDKCEKTIGQKKFLRVTADKKRISINPRNVLYVSIEELD